MQLKSIQDVDLKGKRVVVRFDFNVPLTKTEPRTITDASRIDEAIPTIRLLLEKGASKIVMISHLGRPDGQPNPKYSLEPVAEYLASKLGTDVILSESAVDNGLRNLLQLPETKLVLLENIRFLPGEEKNDMELAEKLSQYGDIYVNDAFGAAHRKHASTYGINAFFKGRAYPGLLMKKEIESLSSLLEKPAKPFVAIVGGAKVSDKIKTIEKLLVMVDTLLIGGAMAYPFLKARGNSVGNSLCSDDDVSLAKQLLAADKGGKIQLPKDHIVAEGLEGKPETCHTIAIPEGKMGLDIGPMTIQSYGDHIKTAKTIFWNGPMGLFESKAFARGTMSIAHEIAGTKAFSVVGGGDSVAAVQQSGEASKFSHVSTGGGASLEYIEKGELPGVQALRFGV
ncbi:phosphoglycerate kinase [Peredibacter starrii]|uniref:Phosphoglycerate kinase n=1 Tax=Peredibacter starrii TaxID=28202 RepID=A0AAX4HNR0_9BACT|nr:phosphoglycerate kinase [Peredibacter starrii]WPU64886.1 phosphoglycerate kinase [Peredibacter starrii]